MLKGTVMIKILDFKRDEKGTRIGFVKFENEKDGMIYQRIAVFLKDGKRWVGMPTYKDETNEKYPFQNYMYYKDKTTQAKFIENINAAVGKFLDQKPFDSSSNKKECKEDELPF